MNKSMRWIVGGMAVLALSGMALTAEAAGTHHSLFGPSTKHTSTTPSHVAAAKHHKSHTAGSAHKHSGKKVSHHKGSKKLHSGAKKSHKSHHTAGTKSHKTSLKSHATHGSLHTAPKTAAVSSAPVSSSTPSFADTPAQY